MFSKLYRKAMIDQDIKRTEVAERLGISPQAVTQRLQRDTFDEKAMREWANAIGMELVIELKN